MYNRNNEKKEKYIKKIQKQAGAELCQAQGKLWLAVL